MCGSSSTFRIIFVERIREFIIPPVRLVNEVNVTLVELHGTYFSWLGIQVCRVKPTSYSVEETMVNYFVS